MYLYETHLHTAPVSACARAGVTETLEFYKSLGYAGVFLTNHFIDGNIDHSVRQLSYEDRVKYFFESQSEAITLGEKIGLSVFVGCEMSYGGTDFLVYGIDKDWCLNHPDMDKMKKSELLHLMIEDGILVIQAHPFHEARYIDHIRLYPRQVHGVEVFNSAMSDFKNELAAYYCKSYELIPFAGSDNHIASQHKRFGGMSTEKPVNSIKEFIEAVLTGKAKPFCFADGKAQLIEY